MLTQHEGDSALLLATAGRLLASIGCPAEAFTVVILPDPGPDGQRPAVLRLRKHYGETLSLPEPTSPTKRNA
jgi:hypothetical protein